ncbi:hypothetical protein [Lactonifactor longoviformis]|uniref:hypothetical protein n=1 Tax=Lactonifactor longoviformis TaxID=341220 RepID=UPI00093434DA|nr:hypothetical protein [Lactonifactor longoviformis]
MQTSYYRELYEEKTQLEEEKEKNRELAARVNCDYTNSSKPSSQSPNHVKIHNGREKTGRKPGQTDPQAGGHPACDDRGGVRDDVNYDGTVKAAAYLLNNQCCVSISKTGEFLKAVSGGKLALSAGMICGLSKSFQRKRKKNAVKSS